MVKLVKHDLEFILKQIEIAEAHAAGGDLAALVAGYNANDGLAQAHLLPYGLRTVNGSFNNLLPGREMWGASDQSFPGIFEPNYLNEADGDRHDFGSYDLNGDGVIDTPPAYYTNNDYGNAGTRSGSQPGPGSGTVIDADPRLISNLVVDQTLANPAAILTALQHAGVPAADLMTALAEITAPFKLLHAVETAERVLGHAQTAVTVAQQNQATASVTQATAQTAYNTALLARDAAQVALNASPANPTLQAALATAQATLTTRQTALTNANDAVGRMPGVVANAEAAAVTAQNTLDSSQAAAIGFDAAADGTAEGAQAALDAALEKYGVEMDGNTVLIPNVSPDEGLSSPFNGWMTIFGQFFDHGLDLVAKGGNGTVYVPLSPDDPLYVPGSPTNYIPLTRVTVNGGPDGILGTADDGASPTNLTTPWVDQNQTYASTASKQVFMREYIPGPDGKPIASGHLLEGSKGGLATWADIKAQASSVLGINLTDANVGNIPLIAADPYGNFIPGPNGYPQLVVGMGPDGVLGTADDVLREGNPLAPVSAQGVVLTGHAFLDDIAHAAVPVVSGGVLMADTDSAVGYANADGSPGGVNSRGGQLAYDNETLDAHYVAGDGRANENIALTAVHHVFHSEHNRVVEMTKQIAFDSMDRSFINEWLLVDLTDQQYAIITGGNPAAIAALSETLFWDGERLFQAGRFTNEMEYQHLVFEEFGRMLQPDIDPFVFEPSADINPSIAAEFAHVIYRFGHSMLRQDIAIIEMDENGNPVIADTSLFEGFLNPVKFDSLGSADEAAGAIVRGMSRQVGSEIDEFVTDVLRNQLLGIPLDLATINLARGRDVGTPPLNEARERFFEATGDTLLKPYTSWADLALNLKNPASIINFIAAYGTHSTLQGTVGDPLTVDELRTAATLLVLGGAGAPADRLDFLNATGTYSGDPSLGGVNNIDFWIGGLAEKKMPFGGMLGSTFAFVFQMTMENLQDADRFYYLSRTQGLNLLNELENNTFAELVMRNTDLGEPGSTALPGNLFSAFEMPTLEMDPSKQLGDDPEQDNPILQAFSQLVERRDANGVLIAASDTTTVAAYIRVNSPEHFTIGGTENNDTIIAGGGDDAIWGRGGNDTIEAGYGVDKVFGGAGDDIITNSGTDIGETDFLHGNEGNDVIHGGSGLALIFGNDGNDFIVTGPDGKEAFGGTGNDFMLGGSGGDALLGNEGDDWLEGGQRFDSLSGENSELFFNSTIIGHDVLNGGSGDTDYDGESGDDVMFQSEGIQRSNGMAGFDWAIHKDDALAANSDLGIPIFESQEAFILRDRFDLVEGLSGWKFGDVLTGREVAVNTRAEATGTAAIPGPNSPLESYSNALLEKNLSLVNGLSQLMAHATRTTQTGANGVVETVVLETGDASDILLGGGGSDTLKGLAGNDVIDGDKWFNVRISIRNAQGVEIATTSGLTGKLYSSAAALALAESGGVVPASGLYQGGITLQQAMFQRLVNPGQLHIVREIVDGNVAGDVDTAVYRDVRANYTFGLNTDNSLFIDHTGFVQVQNDDDLPEGEEGTQNPRSDGRDTLRGIEKIQFSGSTLNVIMGTPFNDNGQTGGANRPVLNGTAQDDLIIGLAGNDTLNGLGGNDILMGNAGNDLLNGGTGDDTYMFGLTDGQDTIQESSGIDRLAIGAGTLTGLNAYEVTNGTGNDNLVIQFNGQQITVTDHFDQAGEAVEFINLDGSTFEGYAFDGDYAISTDDGGDRTAAAGVNTLLAGTTGGDDIIGNTGDDLLFGHDGDDDMDGGDGDDLLVGGSGNDDLIGGLGSDTMVGGTGNDLYEVDDAADVVIEGVNGGTDEVETSLATYTLTANVEDLTYTGAGAFVGTGNAANNVITGGAGVDTLTGLGGNDTYFVTAGDVIVEAAGGGTDTVQSAATYVLGENLENLTLTGNVAINGTGNAGANTITGNSGVNQLFGGGGSDTINGGDGADLIDGGEGDDVLNGGDGNDTDIIIGGAGNDTINLTGNSNGNDIVRYTASGFGADIVNGFDGTAQGGQDLIDLSALGVTAANFAARVQLQDIEDGTVDDTMVTVRDAANAVIGTIRIEEVDVTNINATDFVLAANAPNVISGSNAGTTINGTGGNDTIDGNLGNDTINAGAGDDTIIWNANATGATDGRDVVNGGTEGTAGDTFVINGNGASETYRIYTRAAFDAVPGNTLGGIAAATEIIITRNGTNSGSIIAELAEIEEIRINGFDPAGIAGPAGAGDSFEIIGDFSGTSLRPNTITIDGNADDDTVDISALGSAHRIVFKSNGGNDTIIGALRPQDIIELPAGATIAEYQETTDENGNTVLSNGTHSVCFEADGMPQVIDENGDAYQHHDDDEDEDDDHPDDNDDDDHDDDDQPSEEPVDEEEEPVDETPVPTVPVSARTIVGTVNGEALLGAAGADTILAGGGADLLSGEDGNDILNGEGGDDLLTGGNGWDVASGGAGNDQIHGGTGNDMIFGDAGKDRLYGDDGNDVLEGGTGDDEIWGGSGNDTVLATASDGADTYWGGDGNDTLDYAVATGNLTVDIGNGFMGRGSVTGGNTGTDTVYGFENFIGGSGHDTIIASAVANILDGGLGEDTFRFTSVAAADGDKIYGFQPGDKIDFSAIDAKTGSAGMQHFSLVTGSITAAGQISVTHDTIDGEDVTILRGNVDNNPEADFELTIAGTHNLRAADFNGVS